MDTTHKKVEREQVLNQILKTNHELIAQFDRTLAELDWSRDELQHDHHHHSERTKTKDTPLSRSPSPDLRTTAEKRNDYEKAIREIGHRTEPDVHMQLASTKDDADPSDAKQSFADIMRQKRDLKRRRMKYRTAKAPPLSHSEEIRQLIGVQSEAWTQYLREHGRSDE